MRDLLHLLQDGQFHSGESIGRALGISRAAVWKRLQLLEAELGLTVYRVRGKGYRMASEMSLLDAAVIKAQALELGWSCSFYESLDSTNAEALRQLAVGASSPLLVIAEAQDGGRGRRGRGWISPFGENLYYSLGLRLESGYPLDGLSLTVGLAVQRVLSAMNVDVGMKWPNDLLVGGRKIAGILLELSGEPGGAYQLVIGIGINVNMLPGRVDIDQAWTSLRAERGHFVDRTLLAVALGRSLRDYLLRHEREGFAGLREEWEAVHVWRGLEGRLLAGAKCTDGRILGVDDQGALRFEVAGRELQFSGGELSLRLRDDS
ncbi:bifunctional biotin--[acetyl-CoA-carboxylase] ligase/biotin operon repressor BirA [Pseudomonas sp. zbq_18]|uniref:bifunctional biotin--[acetyl-CoA-carboxylase] ligase/biotin operon repressor BirA n=1 Tax=Pseudomonas sp. zbq_18 TaxID=3367251 RepID=UPI00370B24CC